MRATALVFLGLFVEVAFTGPGPDPGLGDRIGTVISGLVAFGAFWRAGRMRLEASPEGLTVVGYFSTEAIPWAAITGFAVGYGGFFVMRSDGRTSRAVMLGKSSWKTWTKQRSRNEDTMDYLAKRLSAYRAAHPA